MRLRASGNTVYLPVKICTGEPGIPGQRIPGSIPPSQDRHQHSVDMPCPVLHNFQAGHILFNQSWWVLFNAARLILCSL